MDAAGALSMNRASLWAKAGRDGDVNHYHPLFCHMLDSGAVARLMWDGVLGGSLRSQSASAVGLDEDSTGRLLAFLVGVHDIGKASPGFQAKVEPFLHYLPTLGFDFPIPLIDAPHGTVSARVLDEYFRSRPGFLPEIGSKLAVAVGGHHGKFPSLLELQQMGKDCLGRNLWRRCRESLLSLVLDVVGGVDPPPKLSVVAVTWIAGFVSVCDWIASNAEFFPFAPDARDKPVEDYWDLAQSRGRRALDSLGWYAAPSVRTPIGFSELFPKLESPRPLQRAVSELADRLADPALVIIEAPMGEGKTEAALLLMRRWLSALRQRGAYFALPTQATSNQIFSRVRNFLRHAKLGERVDLQLLHGHASLSAEFAELREPFAPTGIGDQVTGEAEVVAAEWFTHRKRGLLGAFGVGTVDQLLLCGLQAKHVFVRLFGVSGKTVIVDEVHAYDTYMTTLLERVVEWLAALSVPVVLLSATLPAERRRRLLEAYARGSGTEVSTEPDTVRYPRISTLVAGSDRIEVSAVDPCSTNCRRLRLEWLQADKASKPNPLCLLLQERLRQGGCAAVVCNTVGAAQRVYQQLKPVFPGVASDGLPELDLLHSRYMFEERERKESRVLQRFGMDRSTRPWRSILVSTQIIEQSLDLDFDLFVTDLAPVDLLLQRAGRLHRHHRHENEPRPRPLSDPTLIVLMPPQPDDGSPRLDEGSQRVYAPHILLRAWIALRNRAAIEVPQDIESLVEQVYSEDPPNADLSSSIRAMWIETAESWRQDNAGDTAQAEQRLIKVPWYEGQLADLTRSGLEEDSPDAHEAFQALTRLAGPNVSVICLESQDALTSTSAALNTKYLLCRSLRITDRRVVFALLQQPVPPTWARSALLRHHRPLVLEGGGPRT